MKMYFSGILHGVDGRLVERGAPRLHSFAYPKEAAWYLDIASSEGIRCDIMIDSGAFTAWNIGKPVQLDALLHYHDDLLQRYGADHDFTFIALDVMPGERGRAATPQEIQDGMARSMENYLIMQEHHTHPVLPVYHSSEPESFRDDFLGRTDHICLSMSQNMTERERVDWAMHAQVENVKLHGLAATGTRIMEYVDWYSVDSAGWLMTAAMGKILWNNGTRITPVDISDTSPMLRMANKHVTNRNERDMLLQSIIDKGYDPEALSSDYIQRCYWNIDTWLSYQPKKRVRREQGLFAL